MKKKANFRLVALRIMVVTVPTMIMAAGLDKNPDTPTLLLLRSVLLLLLCLAADVCCVKNKCGGDVPEISVLLDSER